MAEIADAAVGRDADDGKVGHSQLSRRPGEADVVDQRRRGVARPVSDNAIDVLTAAAGERGESRHAAGERVRICGEARERLAEPERKHAAGGWLHQIVEELEEEAFEEQARRRTRCQEHTELGETCKPEPIETVAGRKCVSSPRPITFAEVATLEEIESVAREGDVDLGETLAGDGPERVDVAGPDEDHVSLAHELTLTVHQMGERATLDPKDLGKVVGVQRPSKRRCGRPAPHMEALSRRHVVAKVELDGPHIIERQETTSSEEEMLLENIYGRCVEPTEEELMAATAVDVRRQYEEEGYVIFRGVLDRTLIAETDAHVDWLIGRHPELRPEQLGHRLSRDDPFWVRLVSDERLVDIAEKFIGPDVALFATHYICKPPKTGQAVRWHQDGAFWPLEPMEVITLWLAITESDPDNGCLRVIPRTHTMELEGMREAEDGSVLGSEIDAQVDEEHAVDLVLEPGDVSVHHPSIVHSSNANTSDRWRRALTIRYIPTSTRITQPGAASAFLLRGHAVEGVNVYLDRPRLQDGVHMPFSGDDAWR